MNEEYNKIIDKLLDMEPDPIPKFVLLKEFKGLSPDSSEYQNAYKKVCGHRFVKRFEESQNDRGFWRPFHGTDGTEVIIKRLLSYGLDNNHPALKRVSGYLVRVLHNEESWDQFEKHDNIRMWPEIFVPLVSAAMLSLIDGANENLDLHRRRWAAFAEASLKNPEHIGGKSEGRALFSVAANKRGYDYEADIKAQNEYFGFKTTRVITPWNYYNLLLLPPRNGDNYLSDGTDQALVDFCMNEADFIYYIYNNNPGEFVSLNAANRNSRDFCHWIRALSLIAQFKGWEQYERKYVDFIMEQRNSDGLWEFPKKYDIFALSDSWRGKNKAIDSTIYVLRLLFRKQAF